MRRVREGLPLPWGDPVPGANIGFGYNFAPGYIWGINTAGNRVFNEDDRGDSNG